MQLAPSNTEENPKEPQRNRASTPQERTQLRRSRPSRGTLVEGREACREIAERKQERQKTTTPPEAHVKRHFQSPLPGLLQRCRISHKLPRSFRTGWRVQDKVHLPGPVQHWIGYRLGPPEGDDECGTAAADNLESISAVLVESIPSGTSVGDTTSWRCRGFDAACAAGDFDSGRGVVSLTCCPFSGG